MNINGPASPNDPIGRVAAHGPEALPVSPPGAPKLNLLSREGVAATVVWADALAGARLRQAVFGNPARDAVTPTTPRVAKQLAKLALTPAVGGKPAGALRIVRQAAMMHLSDTVERTLNRAVTGTVQQAASTYAAPVARRLQQEWNAAPWAPPVAGAMTALTRTVTGASAAAANATAGVARHITESPVGQAAIQSGRWTGKYVLPPLGSAVSGTWTVAANVARFSTKAAATMIVAGAATHTLRYDHFTIPQKGALPDRVQQLHAKELGFARGTTVDLLSVGLPHAEALDGRAWAVAGTAPVVYFPPGSPGQQGTAQIAFAQSGSGRVFGGPSALIGGGYAYAGTGIGTPNLYATEGAYVVGPNVGINLPLLRMGKVPDIFRPGQTTNAIDIGTALSAGLFRAGYTMNLNAGPLTVNVERKSGPVHITADITTGGTLVAPFMTRLSQFKPRVGLNNAFDPTAKDWLLLKQSSPAAGAVLGTLEKIGPASHKHPPIAPPRS